MPKREPPDPNELSFSESLQSGIRDLRARRGPCPTSEELVAFHESRLQPAVAARVRDHVEACGLCDAQLGRLEAAHASLKEPVWEAIRAFLQKPLVPYLLAGLLVYPAYLGLRPVEKPRVTPSPERAEPSPGLASVPSFSLDTVRSGSQNSQVMRVPPGERYFLLSFFVPMKLPPPSHHEVVVLGGDEKAVAPAQPLNNCDALGNCFLLCDSALFPAGSYELVVTETAGTGSKILTRFTFQVSR